MERLCFAMELKPGQELEYDRRHDTIWPEMRDAVSAAGFTNYGLFRRGSLVIGYAECVPDVETVLAKIGASHVNTEWSESFGEIIQSMTDDNGNLITYTEVWHLP